MTLMLVIVYLKFFSPVHAQVACNNQLCDCRAIIDRTCDYPTPVATCCSTYPQCYETYWEGRGYHYRCFTAKTPGTLNCNADCSSSADRNRCPARCPCTSFGVGRWICSQSGYVGPSLTPYPTINIHEGCPNPKDITTALGCVPVDLPENFIGWLLQRLAGLGGGIAFLLVVFGGFKILTSAGNPKGIQAGQEMITSAIIGLLFIIFAIFLLEFIGVKILGIPGLGT